jgi:excisionase family DNA binding protein
MPTAIKNLVILAMSPTHVAQAIGVSENVVRDAIISGELTIHVKGSKSRILVSEVEAWIKSWPVKRLKGTSR